MTNNHHRLPNNRYNMNMANYGNPLQRATFGQFNGMYGNMYGYGNYNMAAAFYGNHNGFGMYNNNRYDEEDDENRPRRSGGAVHASHSRNQPHYRPY
ncbi:hypothetical protein K501DRAFT_76527 [Backusella circina FSU 941]|nr:hypothetical protein K501DRAFT_76527 [Backusella circina FSU 941]